MLNGQVQEHQQTSNKHELTLQPYSFAAVLAVLPFAEPMSMTVNPLGKDPLPLP